MNTSENLKSGSVGIVVGRFQTPQLHEGHLRLLEHVASLHKDMLIVLGSSPAKGTMRNPLDFETRKSLFDSFISSKISSNGWIKIDGIMDASNDTFWSHSLDEMIERNFPGREVILYGGRDSFIPHYQGKFETKLISNVGDHSGTSLRQAVAKMPTSSDDFKKGVIYAAYNKWPVVVPTCDVAITRGKEVILGTKAGDDYLRFPGGFVDTVDTSLEAAAIREFNEEVPGVDFTSLSYIDSVQVSDSRYKGPEKILTSFFHGEYISGEVKAGDDLQSAAFYPLNEETRKRIWPTHVYLYDSLVKHLDV